LEPTIPKEPETPAAARRPLTIWRRPIIRTWVRDLFVSIGISTFFIIFLYQPVRVEGSSMLPGLEDQERIFINKFVYRWEPISRGDIVVFRYPRDPGKSYIKRVVALPGDYLLIDRGRVYVNGRSLDEPYVPSQYADTRSYSDIVVPEGSYFVLGDHRSMSSDSRDFGPIDQQYVIGKAVFIYWPVAKIGLLR
jgi:signal peptidase I